MTLTKPDNRITAGVCILLCALVWLVFGQTLKHGFVNYDDEKHITRKKHVAAGLSTAGVVWAFTNSLNSNWHPLTTMSHMLDCQWYGVENARGHHLTSLVVHAAAAVSLFLVLRQLTGGPSRPGSPSPTGSIWRSAFAAALFAIHPLHVESVAWVAERKDVLSGLFFMLTLAAYVGYVRRPSIFRYLLVTVAFACGLMSKPMLVTLPAVLLLLDFWPLGRFDQPSPDNASTPPSFSRYSTWVFLEKIPLFAMSAGASITALLLQKTQIDLMPTVSLPWRLANAVVTVVIYIWQLLWPRNLAVFYPHPRNNIPLATICVAAVFVVGISAAAWLLRRKRPYFFTGWFWYLIMLLPVIGVLQVGWQGHADRYTYLPHIGLYIAGIWSVADFSIHWKWRREIFAAAALVIIAALVWQARIQTSYWRESETLWRHTLAVTSQNQIAHNNLATVLARKGQLSEATDQFRQALQADPTASRVNYNLAGALLEAGQIGEAITYYEKELQLDPGYANAENNLGHALLQAERIEEAIVHFRKFAELRPNSATAHYNLAVALHQTRRLNEAVLHYERALDLEPDYPSARENLERALREK